MALNVWSHPEAIAIKTEIVSSANNAKLDEFFWLKAHRETEGGRLCLFRNGLSSSGETAPKDAYRIANIVLQGGGVLGLAHAGFVAGLELANVRFLGIAGASAGAIMATGMAVVRGRDLLSATHDDVIDIVKAMPMSAFIDGSYRTRRLIKLFLLERIHYGPSMWSAWIGLFRQILRKRGLNPGNAFEDWLRSVFAEKGVRSVNDLSALLAQISKDLETSEDLKAPAVATAAGKTAADETTVSGAPFYSPWGIFDEPPSPENPEPVPQSLDLLQIMAACTPLGVKFQFPRDARALSASTLNNSPAALVRASMSIPLFFEPATFDVDKRRWPLCVAEKLGELVERDKITEYKDLDEVAFLDGGIFSNLPVDAFRAALPDVPTIAVPLVSTKFAKPYSGRSTLKGLFQDIGTIAFMVRNHRDRDAIEQLGRAKASFNARKNTLGDSKHAKMPPSFPFHLAPITVENINWLNFVMDETEMMELFLMGLRRARDFLERH